MPELPAAAGLLDAREWRPAEDDPRVDALLGLSTCHKRPRVVLEAGISHQAATQQWIELAVGGSLMEVREGAPADRDVEPQGVRGEVEGFSRKSRRRLQRFVAKLDQEKAGCPLFMTLTYPGEWPGDPRVWKRDLKVFGQRMRRTFPEAWWLWRLEPQRRGAPHYHLLVFGVDQVPIEWLSRTWFQVVGSGDPRHLLAGTQVQRVESWRGVMSYVSKYIAKMPEDLPETWRHVGRWWGVENRAAVPICMVVRYVSRAAWFKVRRWVRGLRDSRLPKRARNRWRSRGGATVFLSNEDSCRLIAFAEEQVHEAAERS